VGHIFPTAKLWIWYIQLTPRMSQRLRQRNGCKFFMTCTAQPPEMDKTRAGRGIATILNFFPALPCHQTHFHNRLTTTGRTVVPTADNNNNRLRARQWIYFLQRSKRNARSQHVARHSKKRKTENSPIRSRTRGREDSSTSVGSSGRIPVDQFEGQIARFKTMHTDNCPAQCLLACCSTKQ